MSDQVDTAQADPASPWNVVVPSGGRIVEPTAIDMPYELEPQPEPPPIPNGWYSIAASSDLAPGSRHAVIAAGRELVVFRTLKGEVQVLDAHCPHMGAHLGGGEVDDDTIRCPYHGWHFDRSGTCVRIPYSDTRIPSRACVRSYPTVEWADMVLFWFHRDGKEPAYDVPASAADIPDGMTDATEFRSEFVASLQDMAENNVDYTHFFFVHGRAKLNESNAKFTMDGPFSTVVEDFADDQLVFTRHTYGPGVAVLDVPGFMHIITTTTPIDRRHVRLLWHFHVPVALAAVTDQIVAGVVGEHGLGADLPIWRDKVFRDRPLLVKGDGPIMEFRRWYSQFYD